MWQYSVVSLIEKHRTQLTILIQSFNFIDMKKYVFPIYLTMIFILGTAVFAVIYNYRTHNNFKNWKQCIEASSYSDSDCENCDYMYNRDHKFSLDNFKIDLPEEITQITESDTLKGYFNNNGVLVIEFNNARNN